MMPLQRCVDEVPCPAYIRPRPSSSRDLRSSNHTRSNSHGHSHTTTPKRPLDKSLRLRSMLAMPPTSCNSKFPKIGSSPSFQKSARSAPSLQRLSRSNVHSSSGTLSSHGSNSSSYGLRGNAAMQLAQRSNGATVKHVITELSQICRLAQDAPLQQVQLLSQWASVDAYYKVIICKYQGIPALIQAMRTFPNHTDLQAYCCTALSHLNNKLIIHQQKGVDAIIVAMTNHPNSIAVQSSALEALKLQALLLKQEPQAVLHQLWPLLEHTKDMYLTPMGKESALFLFQFLSLQQRQESSLKQTTTDINVDMDATTTTTTAMENSGAMDIVI